MIISFIHWLKYIHNVHMTLQDNSVPVFEVYDSDEDEMSVVGKVLGKGRSGLSQGEGEGRIMENNLLVQYKINTGEAWLVSR